MKSSKVCHGCDLAECQREDLERQRDPAILEGQYHYIWGQGIDVRPHSILNAGLGKCLRHNDQQLNLGISKKSILGMDLRDIVAHKCQKGEV